MMILRAGLTGCLAAIVNPDATVIDSASKPTLHKAVLRFRSDKISKATGIPFEKVTVNKFIFSTDNECYIPIADAFSLNQYSIKVTGGCYDRSIGNLEPAVRWLAPDNFHEQLIDLVGDRIHWDTDYKNVDADTLISTLPLAENAKMHNMLVQCDIQFNSIYVSTYIISKCDIHQTIYFPDASTDIYRITIEGNRLIVESTQPIDDCLIEPIATSLGLCGLVIANMEMNYEQKIGKINPVNEKVRKETLFQLTDQFGIYSLGRAAIWKNVLLDDCLQDIHVINKMIAKSRYDLRVGK